MPIYRVSKQAKNDLRHIGQYTQREWGQAQRRKYLSGLDEKFILLSDNPHLAAERHEFTPPIRVHHHARHLIVYVVDDTGILIVRVLHQSADIDQHLNT